MLEGLRVADVRRNYSPPKQAQPEFLILTHAKSLIKTVELLEKFSAN